MTCRSWAGDRFGIGLVDVRTPVGVGLADLIEIGLRRNPRRAQLLVSTVLGKHLAVDPRVAAGFGRLLGALVARRLAGQDETPPPTWSAAARSTIRGVQPGALLDLTVDLAPVDLAAVDLAAGTGADHSGVLVLGFAETATALGHLVADQLPGAAYLHSTRRRVPGMTVSAEFSEPHSHAVGHLLSPRTASLLAGDGAVVLVDDELSTGRTALNVITELQAIRPRSRYVLAGLVDVRSTADDRTRAEVAHRLGCRIDVVSLVAGRIELPADLVERVAQEFGDGSDRSVVLPVGAPAEPCRIEPCRIEPCRIEARHIEPCRIDLPWPADVPTGGRHGVLPDQRPGFDRALRTAAAVVAQACEPARRVLVVGSEELMYLPLRIALALAENSPDGEPAGRRVTFQSTTRSPVHAVDEPGYPVRRRIDFVSDDAGTAVTRHLYNAGRPDAGHPDAADHVAGQRADLIVVIDEGDARPGSDGVAAAIAAATGTGVVLCGLPA
jgi:hypothetical protein